MSRFFQTLEIRAAGKSLPDMIQPEIDPWWRANMNRDELSWAANESFAGNSTIEERDDSGASPDNSFTRRNDAVRSNQQQKDNRIEPAKPEIQTKKQTEDQIQESASEEKKRKVHPDAVPEARDTRMMKPGKSVKQLSEEKPKKYFTDSESDSTEDGRERTHDRNIQFIEKVVRRIKTVPEYIQPEKKEWERVAESNDEAVKELMTGSGRPAHDVKQISPERKKQATIQSQPRAQAKPEPEVTIENITIEVVQEKRPKPVKQSQSPPKPQVSGHKSGSGDLAGRETKLRFGLGQM